MIEVPDETVPMYGVLFEPNNTIGTRTYDAAGLVWQRSDNTRNRYTTSLIRRPLINPRTKSKSKFTSRLPKYELIAKPNSR